MVEQTRVVITDLEYVGNDACRGLHAPDPRVPPVRRLAALPESLIITIAHPVEHHLERLAVARVLLDHRKVLLVRRLDGVDEWLGRVLLAHRAADHANARGPRHDAGHLGQLLLVDDAGEFPDEGLVEAKSPRSLAGSGRIDLQGLEGVQECGANRPNRTKVSGIERGLTRPKRRFLADLCHVGPPPASSIDAAP